MSWVVSTQPKHWFCVLSNTVNTSLSCDLLGSWFPTPTSRTADLEGQQVKSVKLVKYLMGDGRVWNLSRCILNSAAAIWVLLTHPEDLQGFRQPHICRSSRNPPGLLDKAPSHSGALEQNSAARGNYRRPRWARWSAGRDNLHQEQGNKMETEDVNTQRGSEKSGTRLSPTGFPPSCRRRAGWFNPR